MYDNQYDISAHISEIVDYLIELINENSVCIIIDNVQNLDEVSIEMFERLIDKEDYKNNVTFVFSFNTDKLYSSTKPYQFHKKIELLYAQKPKYYYCCTVDGFSNDDAEEYITHCLGCKDEKKVEYQKTIKKIVERIGNNPFYIRNYLLYLYQKNIIVRTEFNKFYILNFKEFNNSFLTLPKSILLLIEERESLFFNSLDNKQSKKYKNFFYFISLFKNIPVEMFYSIFNREMLNRLLDSGFIKYQKDEIVFFHHLYDEFFSQNYVIYEAEDENGRKFRIITTIVGGGNYARVLHGMTNAFELKKLYETGNEHYWYYNFIIAKNEALVEKVMEHMGKTKVRKLFADHSIQTAVCYLNEDQNINIAKANFDI